MFDVCRFFFTKEEVLKLHEFFADYKFNTFHWHLTDDQDWRIESRKFPELTRVGVVREPSDCDDLFVGDEVTQNCRTCPRRSR